MPTTRSGRLNATRLVALLPHLREMICALLKVPAGNCQLALLPVAGLPDQPALAMELSIMPKADRTRAVLENVAESLRAAMAERIGCPAVVRIEQLNPETFVMAK